MTERLADVSARIDGIRQLGAVVNAMKGIAAARAHAARTQVEAVDSYAGMIAAAMSSALAADVPPVRAGDAPAVPADKAGVLVFCAEQGFAGAFSERVLDTVGAAPSGNLFLIGTRGQSVAAARGLVPVWTASMPSHSPGIPRLADRITRAIYKWLGDGRIQALDVVYAGWKSGRPEVVRKALFPLDLSIFPAGTSARPLMQLPAETLIASLSADYVHALVCKAALHAFAAENQARMEAMTSASTQIARELGEFEATLRRVRQEAITAEIIELGTGAAAAQDAR